jgi:hypothetical protein
MSEKEFNEKWGGVDTDAIEWEQFEQFKEDCFAMYEETGFSKTFHSPYDETHNHNGYPFKVLRRATVGECDLEAMPLWVVEFKDEPGETFFCYPEEICVLEENNPAVLAAMAR